VFLGTWTRIVTADPFVYPGPVTNSYTVNTRVPGPAPTIAATIDSPVAGTVFTAAPIEVSGTCPIDTYVTLYRNGAFSGVVICAADGTWEIQTDLFPGANELQARVYSQTDVPGPMSNSVIVTYNPPVPPTPPGEEPGNPSSDSTPRPGVSRVPGQKFIPLIFKTTFEYKGQYTGKQQTWQVSIEGGTPPYAISVDWGDGSSSLISRAKEGVFTAEHTYKKAGKYKGSYPVKFSAIDTDGNQTFMQLLSIVNNPPLASGAVKPEPGNNRPDYITTLLKYIWPGYAIVVLMLLSFWLGERREYWVLTQRRKRHRHA
jgi:hypothetical protein